MNSSDAYKAAGKHSGVTNLYPELKRINWTQVDFKEGVNEFEKPFQALIEICERQRDYVRQHTLPLIGALEWERH
ncbi:MAG: hypothetical protein QNJ46_27665 [Leptolyngbyaceae cyanobacterium MO_188.B28]|nr:hypothetical protein [Leptolyngbyaceae cyanobacterium MO_188.B28]